MKSFEKPLPRPARSNDAATLSAQASAPGLNPTQTFGALNGTQTITGNGGLNVINIASRHTQHCLTRAGLEPA